VAKEFNLPIIAESDLASLKQLSAKDLMAKFKIGPLKLTRLIYTVNKNLSKEAVNLVFFPGMKTVLIKLAKQHQLGILTSNNKENVEIFLKKQNCDDLFDFIYAGKNIFGKDKIFSALIKKHKLNKVDILYFGDEVRDIEACQKVGVKVAAVTWGFNAPELLKAKKPNYLLNSPEEIVNFTLVNEPSSIVSKARNSWTH
jgi:phosphoglycolate phosphatase